MNPIKIQKVEKSNIQNIDFSKIPFGQTFSDHMFIMDYVDGKWTNHRIEPYADILVSPANLALHYGQSIFEGMKVHRGQNNEILFFRVDAHLERINRSARRLYMPEISADDFENALHTLVGLDADWVPSLPDSSLYIRPLLFGTDGFLGVRASETYKFIIMCGPSGPYYAQPPRLWVEQHYVRASASGGIGFAKSAGNYAASIMPASESRKRGFDQILWLDSNEYKYIQECGTMNIFAVIGDTIVTPPLSEGILAGITRDSILKLLEKGGYKHEVRPIAIDELIAAHADHSLLEMFGTGTAAVISQIACFGYGDNVYNLPPVEKQVIGAKLKETIEGIKTGRIANDFGWIKPLA